MMCPKCQSHLMSVNRGGLRLEQCEGCRGIFLDRGELEQIIAAEQRHYGGEPHYGGHYRDSPGPFRGRPDSPPPYGGHAPRRGYSDSPPPYGGHAPRRGHSDSPPPYGGHRRKRRSFLEELFD